MFVTVLALKDEASDSWSNPLFLTLKVLLFSTVCRANTAKILIKPFAAASTSNGVLKKKIIKFGGGPEVLLIHIYYMWKPFLSLLSIYFC